MRTQTSQALEGSFLSGVFQVGGNHDVHGEMTLEGGSTVLNLTSREPFNMEPLRSGYLTGALHDLTKVSLIDCVVKTSFGTRTTKGALRHIGSLFPHFVVLGPEYLLGALAPVQEIRFVIDEASTLFYDFDAIGSVLEAKRYIRRIANANFNVTHRKVRTGADARIVYFSGKNTVFSARTALGTVSAKHNIPHSLPDPRGIHLRNIIKIGIRPEPGTTFKDAIERVHTVLGFMELILGRPQYVLNTEVDVAAGSGTPVALKVYWSWAPRRNEVGEGRPSHPGDLLMSPANEPGLFGRVLRNWLRRYEGRRISRVRFSQSFANQRSFTIDRLVGAANMFDLLPASAIRASTRLSKGVKAARLRAENAFRAIPPSSQQSSILDALARLGRPSLRAKILSRAKLIQKRIPGSFPDLEIVIREAVSCRNLFVHGTPPMVDYAVEFEHARFFTDILEFVFAASELVEAGWDIETWAKQGSIGAHPFGELRVTYREELELLKKALAKAKGAKRK